MTKLIDVVTRRRARVRTAGLRRFAVRHATANTTAATRSLDGPRAGLGKLRHVSLSD